MSQLRTGTHVLVKDKDGYVCRWHKMSDDDEDDDVNNTDRDCTSRKHAYIILTPLNSTFI